MKKGKVITIAVLAAAAILAFLVFFKFYFVFGEGVKAGELNFVVYKGYVFKTYEGKVIQSGFNSRSKNSSSVVQSYEFEFSITDPAIADSLMRCGGKMVELHYKEYLGRLPWRGQQKYVVDQIIAVR
ncbi:MAG: hypothetical protein IAC29_02435 [Bacteroidetes bacterium]|uniref:6-phosphogluconate dehydrogenase n=1 Tax=Candidatus Cryptobacteroides merdigallinarum TaxID=2840770 RepID=A0A9D9HFD9_9BACT|nr:hypothetical protein [Candidatus Cryptobacteroides merdigallinarum]